MKRSRALTLALTFGTTAFLLTACNKGGETVCSDYTKARASDQDAILEKWLEQRNGKQPTSQEITGIKLLVDGYCGSHPDKQVANVGDVASHIDDISRGVNGVINDLTNLLPK